MVTTVGRPMAKGVKRSDRNDRAVKVDAIVVSQAEMVARARGMTLAEYLSELLRAPVARDLAAEMRRLEAEGVKGKPAK